MLRNQDVSTPLSPNVNVIHRVSFRGVLPSLLSSGNERHVYTRLCDTREKAEELFAEEPTAYQIDRWEPATKGWVLLAVRDR